jgi:phosphate transport system substrate-binding protein
MNIARWLAFALLLASIPACRTKQADTHTLVVEGSREMTPLMKEIGKRFEAAHPTIHIDVQPGTTSDRGVVTAREGLADIGLVARPLRAQEATLQVTPLARDGIALVVHKSNPVRALTEEQIVGLWTRTLTTWKEVGGRNQAVVLIAQAEHQSARDLFLDYLGLKTSSLRPDQIAGGSAAVVRTIANLPTALGYAAIGAVESGVKEGLAVRALPLEGVAATLANVTKGTYPLRRPLNLVTRPPPFEPVQEFLDFARSPDLHELIRQHGFVPVNP